MTLSSLLLLSNDKTVKELHDHLLCTHGHPQLDQISDINVICGVVKDFLCSLREPLLTFALHETFINAACKYNFMYMYVSTLVALHYHGKHHQFYQIHALAKIMTTFTYSLPNIIIGKGQSRYKLHNHVHTSYVTLHKPPIHTAAKRASHWWIQPSSIEH